jgi:L-lactate dehydrogenase complex protein LldG
VSTARERILGAVRDDLLRTGLPGARAERPDLTWVSSGALPAGHETLVAGFAARLSALMGLVHEADSPESAARIVGGIAREHGATRFLSWDDDQLGCPGMMGFLGAAGLSRVWHDLSATPEARHRDLLALDPVAMGLTGAVAGIADTGGVVVTNGPGRGRLVSLLPPVHVALLRRGRVFASLPALLRAMPGLAAGCSNLVVIAGPSRTADIEMTLTLGMHGPKAVHVILLP